MDDKGFDTQREEIIFVCLFVSFFLSFILSHSGLFTHCTRRCRR